MQRAPENRRKRGHRQREANYKESEKRGEVSRVLYRFFFLRQGPEKLKTLFNNRRLILASVCSSDHVSVKR